MFIYTFHDPLTSCCCWKLESLIVRKIIKIVMGRKYENLGKAAASMGRRKTTILSIKIISIFIMRQGAYVGWNFDKLRFRIFEFKSRRNLNYKLLYCALNATINIEIKSNFGVPSYPVRTWIILSTTGRIRFDPIFPILRLQVWRCNF